jgi:hypothetical protein
MTVAQGGDGGMEYPMFTVISSYDGPAFEEKSSRRSVLGTTVHEFAHMWYYAALGSNEADYAWMDEGFTSYATSEGMAHLTGGTASHSPTSLVWLHKQGLYESFSTPADWFETNTAYGVASYPGGELLVDMLGYVMGEDNRDQWLKRYVRERTFEHPDPYDLELFAEQESGLMLDWYFWQFTRSTRALDDAIDDLETTATDDGYEASFTLEREGTLRMPHDVRLTLEDGSTQWVNVPLASMHGHKPVPDDWVVTAPWPWVDPEKTFTVEVPAPAASATLDPNRRTPDVNRLNNATDFPLRTRFLRAPESSWSRYEVGVRPLALYAHDFGVGGGVQVRGQYYLGEHRLRASVSLWPEVLFSDGDDPALTSRSFALGLANDTGSWFDGLDYELSYEYPVSFLSPRAALEVSAAKHQGVLENRVSLHTPLSSPLSETTERLRLSLLQQLNPSDRVFGLYRSPYRVLTEQPPETETFLFSPWGQSHTASARIDYTQAEGRDHIAALAEAGGSFVGYGELGPGDLALNQSTRASLSARTTTSLGPLTGEAALQVGVGTDGLLPHKRFRLGGRSVEAEWRNDTYRQGSSLFERPVADAHLVGFGPAGPVAYLRADGLRSSGLSGQSVAAGRLSLGGTPFPTVNPLSPLRLSVFSGVGTVWNEDAANRDHESGEWVGDAGVGARYAISEIPHLDRWTAQSDFLQGLDVVAKFPVWASDPGLIDPSQDELAFRWLIGVEL